MEPNKCEACGLQGEGVHLIYVRTTNGRLDLCRQCLDDINRKNPLLAEELEACARLIEALESEDRRRYAAAIRARITP